MRWIPSYEYFSALEEPNECHLRSGFRTIPLHFNGVPRNLNSNFIIVWARIAGIVHIRNTRRVRAAVKEEFCRILAIRDAKIFRVRSERISNKVVDVVFKDITVIGDLVDAQRLRSVRVVFNASDYPCTGVHCPHVQATGT